MAGRGTPMIDSKAKPSEAELNAFSSFLEFRRGSSANGRPVGASSTWLRGTDCGCGYNDFDKGALDPTSYSFQVTDFLQGNISMLIDQEKADKMDLDPQQLDAGLPAKKKHDKKKKHPRRAGTSTAAAKAAARGSGGHHHAFR
eukprot:g15134.t1